MRGWQTNKKAHLCAAGSIRAMPETEIPPLSGGIFIAVFRLKKTTGGSIRGK